MPNVFAVSILPQWATASAAESIAYCAESCCFHVKLVGELI